MTWNLRYQVKTYIRSALWIIPFFALLLEQVAGALAQAVDTRVAWKGFEFGVEGAQALLNAITALTLSFIVFTFASLLEAIQVASGQYTPRIIATTLLRDNVIRYTVAIIAGLLALSCIVAFLFLIDYAARLLRPVSLVQRVGQGGLAVMESVYPERCPEAQSIARSQLSPGPAQRTILHRGKSGIVVAVNVAALVAEAEKAKGVIEFVPQVGDFVGSGEPLFLLHGGAEAVQERKLLALVVFGAERTMDQDPLFALRILVDIAIKALSKAINDSTTAVLAIERLYVLPEDLKLARIPDSQGLGGSSHTEAVSDESSA
jgi:uncharacterized membrane protein